jgi:hypothetical protein
MGWCAKSRRIPVTLSNVPGLTNQPANASTFGCQLKPAQIFWVVPNGINMTEKFRGEPVVCGSGFEFGRTEEPHELFI